MLSPESALCDILPVSVWVIARLARLPLGPAVAGPPWLAPGLLGCSHVTGEALQARDGSPQDRCLCCGLGMGMRPATGSSLTSWGSSLLLP